MQRTTTVIAALIVAALGTTTLTTAAYADQKGGPQFGKDQRHHVAKRMRGGGLLDLSCSPQGAESMEIAFVRLSHRIEMNADQQALFNTLKDTALAAQADFATVCPSIDPATADVPMPDLVERLETRIAVQTAEIEAWTTVLPALESFIGSLTDEQKLELQPRRRHVMLDDRGPGSPGGPEMELPMNPDGTGLPGEPGIEDTGTI